MAIPISHHAHPKTIEITFSFPEFAPACKISVHSIYSFLRYSQFQSPVTRLAMPIFHHVYPKNFWSTFNLCELVSTCKKSGYFNWLVLDIWLIKKSCNLIDWEHFGPYLRNKNFPKYGICAGNHQII